MAAKFDVEQAVKKHLAAIAATGSLMPEDSRELASHLGDSVEQLMLQGLSGEEAFLVATKRLGTERQLAAEYAKINPSMKANRIWVYLIFGFAGILACFGLGELVLRFVHGLAVDRSSTATDILVIATHLSFCGAIGLLIYRQNVVAAYLQKQLQRQPLAIVLGALILFAATTWANNLFKTDVGVSAINRIPMYTLENHFVEFTFLLLLFTIFVGLLGLLFTVKNPENASLKQVFSRPSIWLLLVVGFATETLAASTRILPPYDSSLISAIYFGAVYFVGAFVITYFNKQGGIRYLFWFGILGLLIEVIVGINGDIARASSGFGMLTPYYSLGLIAGVILGYLAATPYRRRRMAY